MVEIYLSLKRYIYYLALNYMVIDIRIFKLWLLETIIFTNAFLQYNKLILQKFRLVDQAPI